MILAKISTKNQIVIPKSARQGMAVKAGDELIVETINGVTVLVPKPNKISKHLRGLATGLFDKGYLSTQRSSWRH